nr:hypothetical protein SBE_002620 [Streptomyces sp. SBE_14.2]
MRRAALAIASTATLICASLGSPALSAPADPPSPALQQETSDAVDVVNEFWEIHWSDHFTQSYQQPALFGSSGFYEAESSRLPTCDGELLGDDPQEKYNAFYCPDEDFLAWSVDFMDLGFNMVGDSWVYLITAHEWGHAIQARLDVSLVDTAEELQADCLAGATLQGATEDGTLTWEEGDTDEVVSALQKLGDTTPWTHPEDHGDVSERINAFDMGVQGGVDSCVT